MFGVGMGEVVLILLIILVVYGPERLPGIARKMGILIRDLRRITSEVQRAIEREIDNADIPKILRIGILQSGKIGEERPSQVLVDLSALRLIDSSGVGAIVALFKVVRAYGGTLDVVGVRDQPLAILRLLHLDRVLVRDVA